MENRVYKARDSNKSATWNRLYNFLLDGVLLLKTLFMWRIYSVLSLKKKIKSSPHNETGCGSNLKFYLNQIPLK